jgi:hypothetical protein
MELKIFFCQFPNPWALRVSGMGGYTSKCEKKSKSLHPIAHCINILFIKGGGGGECLRREKGIGATGESTNHKAGCQHY